jgi:putative ABC transport system permease protein
MILHELHNAARRLRARPGYSSLSIGVLGLGLGAMLFLLACIDGIVLRPLPFADADRLVVIGTASSSGSGIGEIRSPDLLRLREELRTVERIGMFNELTAALSPGGGAVPKRYLGSSFTREMFDLLGVQPLLGRAFSADDDRAGAALTVLLSERVWRDDYDADPAVVGRRIIANGEPATVIGVLPAGFAFPIRSEVWLPQRLASERRQDGISVARLAAGVSLEQARDELEAVSLRLGHELGIQRDEQRLDIKPLAYRFVGEQTRQYVWMMFAACALVLLLACVNVANLQLAQGMTRRRELAVRTVLGASRGRLLGALLAEALLLSLAATLVGLAIAHLGGQWLLDVMTTDTEAPPYFLRVGVDARMLGFAALAALATTLLAGLLPALGASRPDVQDALRDGGKGSGAGFARVARGLVVAEVALTVVLLVGAGTFIRGMQSMLEFDFGSRADPAQILTARIGVFDQQYPGQAERARFFAQVVERLRQQPGVLAASAATAMPGVMASSHEFIAAQGEPRPEHGYPRAYFAPVDEYFADTYEIALRAGRFFQPQDDADSARVAVIDAPTAERLWPGRDPLGQTLLLNPQRDEQATSLTVIGVLDSLHLRSAESQRLPTVLVPLAQDAPQFVTLAVRTGGDPMAFAPQLAAAVRAENADVPSYWLRTHQQAIQGGRIGPVVLTQIFAAVGLLALVLAAAGLYGVLAFAVEQRTREIGIRRAIGAGSRGIVASVSRRTLWQVGLGLAIGTALALPWSALLASQELQTRGYDPAVFATALAVLLAVAIVASLAPLRRALRVDPMVALRQD